MIARPFVLTLAALAALTTAAVAQTAQTQPQTPPNSGAAEAQPTTVSGPGGATTLPANGSLPSALPMTGDPNTGNDFTASPPLGPQKNLGTVNNVTVHYIVGDYIAPPVIYNAVAPGIKAENYRNSAGRFAFEVPVGSSATVYVGGEARRYEYQTPGGIVTQIGNYGNVYLPATRAVDFDEDVRAGVKLTGPRIFLAVSGLRRGNSLGEINERGIGYGIDKLADVDQNFSIHGSVFYYPNVGGNYAANAVTSGGYVSYKVVRYLVGASITPKSSPLFLDAGYLGDYARVRSDAPIGFRHQGPYVGLGIHF